MDYGKSEITVSNRFLYYYSSLIRRVFGMVTRRDGKNVPGTHIVGSLPGGGPLEKPRPSPVPGEIMLFRHRKRLLFGAHEGSRHRSVTFWSEDGRRLHVSERGTVMACGIEAHAGEDVRSYARTVRSLAEHIDLKDIWVIAQGTDETLAFDEIAGYLWGERIDPTQTAALHLTLHRCPYFGSMGGDRYEPLSQTTVTERLRERLRLKAWEREWDELVDWFAEAEGEPYDPDTFTSRQQSWVERIIEFTLHGSEADRADLAKEMLSEISPRKKDLQRCGFQALVRKGIWSPEENVELLRSGRSVGFDLNVLEAAKSVDPVMALAAEGGRRNRKADLLITGPDGDGSGFGLSCRKLWWGRGWEIGLHMSDLTSVILQGSLLDETASDRMGSIRPSETARSSSMPMLPRDLAEACAFRIDAGRPALSMSVRMDRSYNVCKVDLSLSETSIRRTVSIEQVDRILDGEDHPAAKALGYLHTIASGIHAKRVLSGTASGEPASGEEPSSQELLRELTILTERCLAEWCSHRDLPVMYAAQDEPPDRLALEAIENPILRRHEIRRATPTLSYETVPAPGGGPGSPAVCPIVHPLDRYPDLVNLRQIVTFLKEGAAVLTLTDLDTIRFRAREELSELDRLAQGQIRFQLLKNVEASVGEIFDAVVLHVRHDGVLVELESVSLWTLVQPDHRLSAGDRLKVRVTGVDLWLRRLRASAEPSGVTVGV